MIEVEKLSEEEVEMLKKHFLENRIIKMKDILQPIDLYFWKFDFNADTKKYELFLGVPKDWLHDMSMSGYVIELVNETDGGKIIKLITTSTDHVGDLDEMVLFAIDIIQRNNAILSKIREKEVELQHMKDRMVEVQMALDREIEKLKVIKNGDEPEEETEDEVVLEVKNQIVVGQLYETPVNLTKEEADKFVELVRNGK